MQSAEDYKARAPDRGLKMKSRLEFLAEHTEKGVPRGIPPPAVRRLYRQPEASLHTAEGQKHRIKCFWMQC